MARFRVVPIDQPEVAPLPISARLSSQIVYFMSAPDADGVPELKQGEYWIAEAEVERILEEGTVLLISPLDSENATEVEITEEQESFLEWLQAHRIQHLRVEDM